MNPSASPVSPPPSPLYSASTFSRHSGPSPLLITSVLFGLGTLVFGLMAMVYYNQAVNTRNSANQRLTAAVTSAKATQKQEDDDAYAQLAGTPFRSYIAPVAFGSFDIKFPKNWASYVVERANGTQVNLQLTPDFVQNVDNVDQPNAARIMLQATPQDQFMNQYDQQVKQGRLKKTVITVSGLPGYDLTGSFSEKKIVRMVIIPIRDKVIIFQNENSKYANDFNDILAQSHLNP
ncbi:MAG TPA: hypothetical protein VI322_02050 [Candidatus Saccharimonadia bacterium]